MLEITEVNIGENHFFLTCNTEKTDDYPESLNLAKKIKARRYLKSRGTTNIILLLIKSISQRLFALPSLFLLLSFGDISMTSHTKRPHILECTFPYQKPNELGHALMSQEHRNCTCTVPPPLYTATIWSACQAFPSVGSWTSFSSLWFSTALRKQSTWNQQSCSDQTTMVNC